MAQLFPGVLLLLSISVAIEALFTKQTTLSNCIESSISNLTSNPTRSVLAIMLSVGLGMAIHGLNWAVIGFIEYEYDKENKDKGIYESFWHDKRILWQILLGPVKMLIEICDFLWRGKELKNILLQENVNDIPREKWNAFMFVENFYLYFAQFYAHIAYALISVILTIIIFMIFAHAEWKYAFLLIMCWIACGGAFIVSRIQYGSMFTAEWALAGKYEKKGKRENNNDVTV